jgi:hypothetical protein
VKIAGIMRYMVKIQGNPTIYSYLGWDQVPGEGGQVPGGGQQALPGGQGHGGCPLLQQVPVLLPPPRSGGVPSGPRQGPELIEQEVVTTDDVEDDILSHL